jgi:hypothetical protein
MKKLLPLIVVVLLLVSISFVLVEYKNTKYSNAISSRISGDVLYVRASTTSIKDADAVSTRSSKEGALPPTTGDWEISNGTVYLNDTSVVINGNLTIKSGGALVLTNSILKINSTQNSTYWLNIVGGGLYINFSNLTSYDKYIYYFYANGGTVVVNNSRFEGFAMKDAVWYLSFFAYNSYIGSGLYFIYGTHRIENSTTYSVSMASAGSYINNCTFLSSMGVYTYSGVANVFNSSIPNGYLITYTGTIYAVNTTYKSPPQITSQGSGKIIVKNYLYGKVIGSTGAPVSNASITIKNKEGIAVSQNLTTLPDGTIPTQTLILFEQNLTAINYFTPYTIIVGNAKPQINISASKNITINKDAPTDLAILSPPMFSDANPVPTQNITINVTVANIGDSAASNLQVDFYVDSMFIVSSKISSINANSNEKTSVNWTTSEGAYSIRAAVNGTNEWLLDNNENNESLIVSYVNVFKNRDVVIIESDGWGSRPESQNTLKNIASVLEKHMDVFGITPAISAYIFTGDTSDFQKIRSDNYNNYYFIPISNAVVNNYIAYMEKGVFYPGYNGFTHFNKDVWLSALKNNDAVARSAFLSNIVNASIRYDIYSEYSNYNTTPPISKTYSDQNKIIQTGITEFYRLFNFYPDNTVSANYTWNNITEKAWYDNNVRYISSTTVSGGEKNDYGMRYIRRNVVQSPIEEIWWSTNSVNSILSDWEPVVITTPVGNYIDSVGDEKTVSQNLRDLDSLLLHIEAKNDIIYLTSGELGQLYSSGHSFRQFGNNTIKTTIVRNYLPTRYQFNVSTSGFQNFTIEAIKLNDNTVINYTIYGDTLKFNVNEGDYKVTIKKNVTRIELPTAVAKLNRTSAIAGENIKFNASQSYPGNSNYTLLYMWDFGDDTTETGEIVIHKYTKEGIYPVTLTVEQLTVNGSGGINTTTINVTILPKTAAASSTSWSAIEKLPYIGPFLAKYWWIVIGIVFLIIVLLIVRYHIKRKKARRRNVWISGKDLGKKDLGKIEHNLLPAKCPHCYRNFNVLAANLPGEVYCPFCGNVSLVKNPLIRESKVTIRCPICKKTGNITVYKRPTRIRCPFCNAAGFVR